MAAEPLNRVVQHIRRLAGVPDGVTLSDRHLLDRYLRQGDRGALEVLVARYSPLVYGVCRRILGDSHDAEDAFQATFLVLFRKAQSIRGRDTLGPWLYGVAYRVATRARSLRSRQRSRERPLEEAVPAVRDQRPSSEEIVPLLYAEIDRLPSKYQKPIILCYLQGKKRDEAAQLLGWSRGMVKGRLERGRDLLRARLLRRGFELSTVAVATVLSQNASSAAPAELVDAAVKTAILLAVRGTAAGLVSGTVGILAEGVLRSMMLTKIGFVAVLLFSLGTLTAGGVAVGISVQADEPQKKSKEPRANTDLTEPKAAPPFESATKDKGEREWVQIPALRDGVLVSLSTGAKDRRRKGDRVKAGEALASLDDRLAQDDVLIKRAKVTAAKAELEASRATFLGAKARSERQTKLHKKMQSAEEELREAQMAMERYGQEVLSKEQTVRVAELELRQAATIVDMYTIRSPVSGVIMQVHKRPGEAVKAYETIMRILVEE